MAYKKQFYRSWDELPLLLTLGQCAMLFGKSYETMRTWVAEGILPAEKVGREYRVAKAALIAKFEGGVPNG